MAISLSLVGAVWASGRERVAGPSRRPASGSTTGIFTSWETRGALGNTGPATAAVATDSLGNAYVAGKRHVAGTDDFLVVKYDVTGKCVWQYTCDGDGDSAAVSIGLDAHGGVFATGYAYNQGSETDFFTVRLSSADGSVQPGWPRRYNWALGAGTLSARASCLAVDADGNVVVTGSAATANSLDYATVKYRPDGTYGWSEAPGPGGVVAIYGPDNVDDQARRVAVDAAGNVFVTGTVHINAKTSFGTAMYAASTGALLFEDRYNYADGNGPADAYGLVAYGTGTAAVVGRAWTGQSYDYATVKYDAALSGNHRAWTGTDGQGSSLFGDTFNPEEGYAVAVDAVGDLYVTGEELRAGPNLYRFATLKLNGSNGQVAWGPVRYGTGDSAPSPGAGIAVDSRGMVVVAGVDLESSETGYDFVALGYAGSTGANTWTYRYANSAAPNLGDAATGIALGRIGETFVTGWSSNPSGTYDNWTVRLTEATNHAPVASPGGPYAVSCPGIPVQLDASASTDPDAGSGDSIVRYEWFRDSIAPAHLLSSNSSPLYTVTSPGNGMEYTVWLRVTDYWGQSAAASTLVSSHDALSPILTVPSEVFYRADPALTAADVDADPIAIDIGNATATDNCGAPVVTASRSDGRTLAEGYGSGTTIVTWTATDEAGNSTSAQQRVTVRINSAPVANPDSFTTWKNCTLRVVEPGLIANDSDPDGDEFGVSFSSTPQHGSLSGITGFGAFIYTPDPGYVGTDSFTYHPSDSGKMGANTTVTIQVREDATKPTCVVGSVVTQTGPPLVYVPLTASDSGSGVASIQLTANSSNCKLVDPGSSREVPVSGTLTFDPSVSSVGVRVVKLDPTRSARVEVRVTDCSGNVALVDPVIVELIVPRGAAGVTSTFTGLPEAEHYVSVENRRPGVRAVAVRANGVQVGLLKLSPNGTAQLDAARQMRAGADNTFTISALGAPGSRVLIVIGDAAMVQRSQLTATTSRSGKHPLNLEWGR